MIKFLLFVVLFFVYAPLALVYAFFYIMFKVFTMGRGRK